eukprot:TRINITY_DN44432_c0_g1_i2.p1 TRINITY_DN44432_c0_g1~~TRINITY_DN44432_c0_g1_i2.p1  ORF type:complete len:298 (-),score=53.44 TRINITY_DN44432_c0_g1_i2:567-1460(-)
MKFFGVLLLLVAISQCSAEYLFQDEINADNLNIRDYTDSFGYSMVHIASAAYCNTTRLEYWDCPLCRSQFPSMTDIFVVENDALNSHVFAGRINDIIVVSFRGTKETSIKNWVTDIHATHTNMPDVYNCKDCEVHTGFYAAYSALRVTLLDSISQIRNRSPVNIKGFFVVGHSLGGALATLHAFELRSLNYENVKTITFGSPRVGNQRFAEEFAEAMKGLGHFRVTHHRDLVPKVPPKPMGFQHVEGEVFYAHEDSETFQLCNDYFSEDSNCQESLHCWSIGDHLNYVRVRTDIMCK